MQPIALGKKSCLEFRKDPFWDHYFLTFSCVRPGIILEGTDFASYADDNTPFVSEATPENVVSSLESCSSSLFE